MAGRDRLARRCPWCESRLSRAEPAESLCPACRRPLRDGEGRPVRKIDAAYDSAVEDQQRRFQGVLAIGGPIVAVVFLLVPLLHLGGIFIAAIPVLLLGHLAVMRWVLFYRTRLLLGARRRMFHRWFGRLGILWLGAPGYSLTAVPVAGALLGTAVFLGLSAGWHHYTLWSLARERDRLPLTGWEKAVLAILAVLTIVALVGLALLLFALGWAVQTIWGWFD